jgi:uncharacterized membrane protein
MRNIRPVELLIVLIIVKCILLIGAGLVAAVVFAIARQARQQKATSPSISTAREILQQRYARGEITREQYQLMLSDLDNSKGVS